MEEDVEGDGWLLVTGMLEDPKYPEGLGGGIGDRVWILVDNAASVHVCGEHDFPDSPLQPGINPHLKVADGHELEFFGLKSVWLWFGDGGAKRITIHATSAKRIILSAGLLAYQERITTITSSTPKLVINKNAEMPLHRFGAMTFMLCAVLSADVNTMDVDGPNEDEEQLEKEALEAVIVDAPHKPSPAAVERHRASHIPYARWCKFCV